MEGDSQSGVSIIQLVEELDAGPVVSQEATPISPEDDFESLSDRLVGIGARLLSEALTLAAEGRLKFVPQSDVGVTYAERFAAEDRSINSAPDADAAERKVRALRPHVGARLELPDGETIGVRAATIVEAGSDSPGVVVDSEGVRVGFTDATLQIDRLIPPGGREMQTADWLRGRST